MSVDPLQIATRRAGRPGVSRDLAHLAEWRRAGRAVKLADMTTSTHTYPYLIGVDGGGSGTRVVLADANGVELARATGGPSGLGLGVERAWEAIAAVCSRAFDAAGLPFDWRACALGCGLAGVNHAGC